MRTERFTFLCTTEEKQALEGLASALHRSKSDTIRLLIITAVDLQRWSEDYDRAHARPKGDHDSHGADRS
jgi:predicted transcriptional regulator